MGIGDFTDQADAYHRSRPSYPAAMLDELAAELGLAAGHPVVDIGAGTGILTTLLAERGFSVSAVEPNAAMAAYARPHPSVRWIEGTFEATGLAPSSQRWAVAAQAFHWADPPLALPEIARVLEPGAAFTAMFNDRDHETSELMTFVRATMQREVPGFDEAYRERDWEQVLKSGGTFSRVSYREVAHVVPMTRERFLSLWRGHNRLNNIAGPERFARFFDAVSDHLATHAIDEVPVAYRCRAWTAHR